MNCIVMTGNMVLHARPSHKYIAVSVDYTPLGYIL